MIDFNRFWAERGCGPGMSREQTEEYLAQMGTWLQSLPGASGKFDASLIPGMNPGPGVKDAQLADWERGRGVCFPQVLRQAFAQQDGGFVRETQFRILPLDEIENPEAEFWQWASFEGVDVPDRRFVFQFAEDDVGGNYLLIYEAGRPEQDPAVFVYHSDPGEVSRCAKSVATFFDRMLKTSDSPSVDWAETAAMHVIAQETIDLSAMHGGRPAGKEQILGRDGGAIVLFTCERTPGAETYSKTVLREPLLEEAAMLWPGRPAPVSTYGLMLQPRDTESIVAFDSRRTGDGRWKNSASRGTPVCVIFESAERQRLEGLRRDLFGKKAADRAKALEDRQRRLETKLSTLSPDERSSAMIQVMLQMRERYGGVLGSGLPAPEGAQPELSALFESLHHKLREAKERGRDQIAKHPLGPEIVRQFGEIDPEILRMFGLTVDEPDPEDETKE
jgi:hypothetical protein